jgi:hypothetical protein
MPKLILGWIGIALVGASYLQAASQELSSPSAPALSQHRALLNRYCVTCHNEKLRTAELMLDKIDVENVSRDALVWEKILLKLRTGAMPPASMPRPDKATYESFSLYLETELDRAAAANPDPGRPVLHRLNRAEYTNAIRDLIGLKIDPEIILPRDPSSRYGFDNIGEGLTVSPLLMERYLSAARKISRLAIGDPTIRPATETYTLPENFEQNDRVSEDLPFGSRGGTAIRHYFPLDGEYVVQIYLSRDGDTLHSGPIRGFNKPTEIDVRLDGERLKRFTVGGENKSDEGLEVRFRAKAGMRLMGISFLKDTLLREGSLGPRGGQRNAGGIVAGGGVGWVSISGPYNVKGWSDSPSRRKIFVCQPTSNQDQDEEVCAQKILTTLVRRAYRRPVTDEDVQPLLRLYKTGRDRGGFEVGIGRALQGILVSSGFLFRFERDPENLTVGTAYRISDVELASRLSFFLWSSIPDDELLELAEKGSLQEPAVLERQVRRMLQDPRSEALIENFTEQWLQVRNLRFMSPPDQATFPEFNVNLRDAMEKEIDLFFASIMNEDRSVLDLLNADYTFLNERLARLYGIPGVYGNHTRRVRLSDENRWGLLGKGGILTVTSYATRTSPTLRGKWMLENILGSPPPPPPPNVPSLRNDEDVLKLSMRQRMDLHRTDPVCASCHKIMDPLGFALENFDAIGRWRTDNLDRTSIDVSGKLPNGTEFNGAVELREIVLGQQREQFVGTFTEKLLTYALGRAVQHDDKPAVRKIMREANVSQYRWSSIVLGIVKSIPFQMRRSQEP